jgi:cyclic-di-GMP-binding protein
MSKNFSFDIECKFDLQELKNSIDQTNREIQNRFDFKNVFVEIKQSEDSLNITTESEYKLDSIKQILISKLVKRDQSPNILDWSKKIEKASGMNIRQEVKLIKALNSEQTKKITKLIKEQNFKKVKTSIQGDIVRVESSSKNDLQEIMQLIKNDKSIDAPLSFCNFR